MLWVKHHLLSHGLCFSIHVISASDYKKPWWLSRATRHGVQPGCSAHPWSRWKVSLQVRKKHFPRSPGCPFPDVLQESSWKVWETSELGLNFFCWAAVKWFEGISFLAQTSESHFSTSSIPWVACQAEALSGLYLTSNCYDAPSLPLTSMEQ